MESQYKPQPFLQLRTDSQSEAVAIQAIRNAKGNSICVDCGAPSERKGAAEGSGRESGSRALANARVPMLPARPEPTSALPPQTPRGPV